MGPQYARNIIVADARVAATRCWASASGAYVSGPTAPPPIWTRRKRSFWFLEGKVSALGNVAYPDTRVGSIATCALPRIPFR